MTLSQAAWQRMSHLLHHWSKKSSTETQQRQHSHCQTVTGYISSLEMHLVMKANRLSKVIQEPASAQIHHWYFLFSHLQLLPALLRAAISQVPVSPNDTWKTFTHVEHGLNMVFTETDVYLMDPSSRWQLAAASPISAVFEILCGNDKLMLHSHEQTGPARKQNPPGETGTIN